MIKAYCGRFGSGKTLSMVIEAHEYLKKGYTVYTNTPFYYDHIKRLPIKLALKYKKLYIKERRYPIYLKKLEFEEALKTATNAVFMLDEASIWLNNYKWSQIDDEVMERLFQVRKLNIHLIYTAQFFMHVVKKLRDFTDTVVECKIIHTWNKKPTVLRQISYSPEFYGMKIWSLEVEQKYIDGRRFIWGSKLNKAMESYDTNEIISFKPDPKNLQTAFDIKKYL